MVIQLEDLLARARGCTVHQQQPVVHTLSDGVLLPQTHPLDNRSRIERGFALADRVVYIRGCGTVPFGLRGTVVAMCGEIVEVRNPLFMSRELSLTM